jgi:uncharacterized protein
MTIVSTDISREYIINNISGSLAREERIINFSTTTNPAGAKTVTIANEFNSVFFAENDVLRISDGTTVVDYIAHSSAGTLHIVHGMATDATSQFTSKINASALNITAVDNGGSDTNASFTLIPGSGATITVTEHPGGDGNFGTNSDRCTVASGGSLTTTTKHRAAPMRVFIPGAANIRGQDKSPGKHYKTFIGRHVT